MEFSGRLAAFPIADLLSWAHNDRRSGALVVRRSGTEKRVYFRDGEVVACLSSDPAEFYGQYLLAQGWVDDEGLVRALTLCQRERILIGTALERLGLLSGEQVLDTLRQHVVDQVCELFLWKSGIFYLTNEVLPEGQVLPEPLAAAGLALEGSRRVDEHTRIRRLFVHDNIVLRRGEKAVQDGALEKRISRAVDGQRSLVEIYNEVRGSWFRFLATSYALTVSGMLDIEDVHEPAESGSTELRLADLMLEQVAEERATLFRHHLALPLDAIDGCYPVWMSEPAAEEEGRASNDLRAFYRRIDGRTLLADIFGAVPLEERAALLDHLVVEFRAGRLALLPISLDEIERGESGRPPTPGSRSGEGEPAPAGGGSSAKPVEPPRWWRGLLGRTRRS